MRINRTGRIAALALAGGLALAACGSNNTSSGTGDTGSPSPSGAKIDCATGSIKASGSSAQKNAMAEWINAYQEACSGATINYSPSGSGAGIQDFINNQVAFAGSDSALKPEEQPKADARCGSGNKAINIPMVTGPIAIAYNLQGVDKLVMTPDVLAGIFGNTITKWNDPKIAAANPGVTLPDQPIAQFHRSDSSGTTDNFTKYLTAAAGSAWTYGKGKEWKAPGGQGAKGSDGVAQALKQTPNSIGYVEFSFTQEGGLGVSQIDNGGGAVELSAESAGKGVESAEVVGTGNDLALDLKTAYTTKTPGAYPIILVTYEITCEKGLSSSDQALTKSFLTFTSSDAGQAQLADLGYAPLPSSILTKVQSSVAAIS